MRCSDVLFAQTIVMSARRPRVEIPGWIAELAKADPWDPPPGTLREFHLAVGDSVPEFVVPDPWPRRYRRGLLARWRRHDR